MNYRVIKNKFIRGIAILLLFAMVNDNLFSAITVIAGTNVLSTSILKNDAIESGELFDELGEGEESIGAGFKNDEDNDEITDTLGNSGVVSGNGYDVFGEFGLVSGDGYDVFGEFEDATGKTEINDTQKNVDEKENEDNDITSLTIEDIKLYDRYEFGDTFRFNGKVLGNGALLENICAYYTDTDGGEYLLWEELDLNEESYKLSKLGRWTVGEGAFKKTGYYTIYLYGNTINGLKEKLFEKEIYAVKSPKKFKIIEPTQDTELVEDKSITISWTESKYAEYYEVSVSYVENGANEVYHNKFDSSARECTVPGRYIDESGEYFIVVTGGGINEEEYSQTTSTIYVDRSEELNDFLITNLTDGELVDIDKEELQVKWSSAGNVKYYQIIVKSDDETVLSEPIGNRTSRILDISDYQKDEEYEIKIIAFGYNNQKETTTLTINTYSSKNSSISNFFIGESTNNQEMLPYVQGLSEYFEITEGEKLKLNGKIYGNSILTVVTVDVTDWSVRTGLQTVKPMTDSYSLSNFVLDTSSLNSGIYTIRVWGKTAYYNAEDMAGTAILVVKSKEKEPAIQKGNISISKSVVNGIITLNFESNLPAEELKYVKQTGINYYDKHDGNSITISKMCNGAITQFCPDIDAGEYGVEVVYYDSNMNVLARGERRVQYDFGIKNYKIANMIEGETNVLYGVVSARKGLSKITIQVLNSAGQKMINVSVLPKGEKSYKLSNYELDSKLEFNKLPTGQMHLRIIAQDNVGESLVKEISFTVNAVHCHKESIDTERKLQENEIVQQAIKDSIDKKFDLIDEAYNSFFYHDCKNDILNECTNVILNGDFGMILGENDKKNVIKGALINSYCYTEKEMEEAILAQAAIVAKGEKIEISLNEMWRESCSDVEFSKVFNSLKKYVSSHELVIMDGTGVMLTTDKELYDILKPCLKNTSSIVRDNAELYVFPENVSKVVKAVKDGEISSVFEFKKAKWVDVKVKSKHLPDPGKIMVFVEAGVLCAEYFDTVERYAQITDIQIQDLLTVREMLDDPMVIEIIDELVVDLQNEFVAAWKEISYEVSELTLDVGMDVAVGVVAKYASGVIVKKVAVLWECVEAGRFVANLINSSGKQSAARDELQKLIPTNTMAKDKLMECYEEFLENPSLESLEEFCNALDFFARITQQCLNYASVANYVSAFGVFGNQMKKESIKGVQDNIDILKNYASYYKEKITDFNEEGDE